MIAVMTGTAAMMTESVDLRTGTAVAMIGIDVKAGTVAAVVRDPLKKNTAARRDVTENLDVTNVIKIVVA